MTLAANWGCLGGVMAEATVVLAAPPEVPLPLQFICLASRLWPFVAAAGRDKLKTEPLILTGEHVVIF